MPITVQDRGSGNLLSISPLDLNRGNGLIELRGNGNQLVIEPPHAWGNPHIILDGNAQIRIGPQCVLSSVFVYAASGAQIKIGARTGFSGTTTLAAHEPSRIIVGEDCLFGSETHVLGSDMHSVVDRNSGRRLNPARDILISNRVWIGFRVVVLKGSTIGEGSVIGAGAVVSGEIPPHCAAAGNPARVVREAIIWDRALLPVNGDHSPG